MQPASRAPAVTEDREYILQRIALQRSEKIDLSLAQRVSSPPILTFYLESSTCRKVSANPQRLLHPSTAMNSAARKYTELSSHDSVALMLTGSSLGALGITFGLPILTYAFAFMCNDVSGCPAPSALHPSTLTLETLKREVGWPKEGIMGLGSWSVTGWVLMYYLTSLTLQAFLPGEESLGVELSNGGRLKYKFNGG